MNFKKYSEKNGLTVAVSPMTHMASISIGIWIGIGGRFERPEEGGLSHFVEHMLFKGTLTRSARELKEAIEGVGGSFNGFTSDEVTCYMVKVPAKRLDLGLDILSDMVINPRFDELDMAKEKFVISEEIKMYRDQPADHILEVLSGLMWPGNALGRPLTGTVKAVKGFKREDLVRFKGKYYHPANMAIIGAGKLDPERFRKSAIQRFAGLVGRKKPRFEEFRWSQHDPRIKFVKDDTKQAHLSFGFPVPGADKEQKYAIKVMDVALGGNMSSRLFEELREKNGLCYDISSAYKSYSDSGEMIIHAGVDSKKALMSAAAIVDQVLMVRDVGLTEEEIERSKDYIKGQFLLAMERTSARMLWIGDRFMVERNIPDPDEVLRLVGKVTLNDVKAAAAQVFSRKRANLAVIGDLARAEKTGIRKALERL
ncbi:MAG: pitrilysin family protein [Candidatus Omnitrophica bacterium]|nr:pitrilysin family protein [Candidatus Omnitrophota bacterium]MDD4012971.1 pitrilysin family protein [Candidatus Omnitrophota bacterium]